MIDLLAVQILHVEAEVGHAPGDAPVVPMITPGIPGSVAPVTSRSGAFRCTRYHSLGQLQSRCGSLARIGLPVAERAPEIAQAFDPGWTSPPVRRGYRKFTLAAIAALEHVELVHLLAPGGGEHAVHLQE